MGRAIAGAPSLLLGWMLVVANMSAFVFAEVCWIHWNLVEGAESWWAAVMLLPRFVAEYELSVLIGAIFTAMGCWSAYRRTAMRFRLVPVDDI